MKPSRSWILAPQKDAQWLTVGCCAEEPPHWDGLVYTVAVRQRMLPGSCIDLDPSVGLTTLRFAAMCCGSKATVNSASRNSSCSCV